MRRINYVVILLLVTIFLSACSSQGNEEVIKEIDKAVEQNRTLENATFEKNIVINPEALNQKTEGVFIALGNDEYNWSRKEYLGSENSFHQIVEIDGQQYEMQAVDEADFEPDWQAVQEQSYELIDQIRPLLENKVDERFIDRVEENDSEGQSLVIYLTDAYIESIVSENVSELENDIRELEEAQDDTGYIQALEGQIKMIEAMEYSDPKFEVEINKEGYLTKFVENYSYTVEESEPVTVTSECIITDYNIENTDEFFPDI